MIGAHALLGLQLEGHELIVHILHPSHTGKGHLLIHVMAEPVAADGVAVDAGDHRTEEQPSVEHGLDGEPLSEGDRHAPVGTDDTRTGLLALIGAVVSPIVHLGEVVGQVGIFRIKAHAAGGEDPVVLVVIMDASEVTVEMFVLHAHVIDRIRLQLTAIVHIVPLDTHLEVKGAQVEVDGCQLRLCLVIQQVIVAIAIHIDIQVVASEGETQRRTGETARVEHQVGTQFDALTQPQGEVGADRCRGLQRHVETHLQGGILLGVEAETHIQTVGTLPASRETHHVGGILRGDQSALRRRIEEVDTHGGRDLLFLRGVDAVELREVELLTQELLIALRHVLELKACHALFIGHDLGIHGVEEFRTERIADADALFQGDQLVPVAHRLLLTASDQ